MLSVPGEQQHSWQQCSGDGRTACSQTFRTAMRRDIKKDLLALCFFHVPGDMGPKNADVHLLYVEMNFSGCAESCSSCTYSSNYSSLIKHQHQTYQCDGPAGGHLIQKLRWGHPPIIKYSFTRVSLKLELNESCCI